MGTSNSDQNPETNSTDSNEDSGFWGTLWGGVKKSVD